MTDKQVWLITGAGRGMGIDIARAALAAGHAVVGTARNAASVTDALGEHDDLLAVPLDVTDPAAAEAAVAAAVERFGHLDVLVNNAGSFYAGFFEEMAPEDFRAQIESTLFGPVNVTRAALPQMRAQRSGLVVTISSTAGIASRRLPHRLRRLEVRRRGVHGGPGHRGRARSASRRCWSSPGSSAPSSSAPSRPATPSRPSRTTPSAPAPRSRAGRAWTASRAATPPSSPTRWSSSSPSMSPRAVRRRRRRRRALRDQGPDPPRPGRRPPRAVQQPRPRRRLTGRQTSRSQ